MDEFHNPIAIQLHAILDSPDDQTAPTELHRFSNALSTLHKVSLLVHQIALSDRVPVAVKLDYHPTTPYLSGMTLPILLFLIHRHLTYDNPHWLHRL